MNQSTFFGPGSIQQISAVLDNFTARRVFLVTGKHSFALSGAKKKLHRVLASCEVKHFAVSVSLPELAEVAHGVKLFQKGDFDLVLAVGGGAVLDIAKLISIFSTQTHPILVLINQPHLLTRRNTPLIVIPTTAGSGAEATHFAVLYIDKIKHSIAHPSILPDIAIVDPDLTLSMPPQLAAITGLDALSQGIESYWSVNATEQSKKFAHQAIKLAYHSLLPAVRKRDSKACIDLSKAALMAGQAINISKTTAPHALSYTLTAHFDIPHGHAVFLTLGEFLVHNSNAMDLDTQHPRGANYVRNTIQEICTLLDSPDAVTTHQNLQTLMFSLGLETHLSSLGITKNDFDFITQNINLERLANHPRKVTHETVRSVLESIA